MGAGESNRALAASLRRGRYQLGWGWVGFAGGSFGSCRSCWQVFNGWRRRGRRREAHGSSLLRLALGTCRLPF
jgi:hypothetical protein